jgi:hypothetical protein
MQKLEDMHERVGLRIFLSLGVRECKKLDISVNENIFEM